MIYYLGVRFSDKTNSLLSEYRLINGLSGYEWPKMEFHSTIVYSRESFSFKIKSLPSDPIGFTNDKAYLFGTSHVLTYESDWLRSLYIECINNGAVTDHKHFVPHITIVEDIHHIVHSSSHIPITVNEIYYREWKESV